MPVWPVFFVAWRGVTVSWSEANQTPMSRPTFAALISGKEYTQLKPDNCCCASCRDLGFYVFELLREIVRDVCTILPTAIVKQHKQKLLDRIEQDERFQSGERITHLKDEDPCAAHCLGHLCSSFNNEHFRADCTHGRYDGKVVSPPPTMEGRVKRAVRSSDWMDECSVCYATHDENKSRLLCCEHCEHVAHKDCIAKHLGNDLPTGDNEWVCPSCVREHDAVAHDSRCLKCEEHFYLLDDIRTLCELAQAEAQSTDASTEIADWGLAVLDTCETDLDAYMAHLARNECMNHFQPWVTSVLQGHQFTMLYDYWAKQPDQRSKQGVCEGTANIGVSVQGVMITYRNPELDIRARFPDVPWESYPDPPSARGPEYCRDFVRQWSDSCTQDSFDTAAELLALQVEFLRTHPWLSENVGEISDGASNYLSTSPLIYALLNPYTQVKATSVEGEGKDGADGDNARQQQVISQARAHTDLTYTVPYMKVCNARRARNGGAQNTRAELNRELAMSKEEKSAMDSIDAVHDLKLCDVRKNGPGLRGSLSPSADVVDSPSCDSRVFTFFLAALCSHRPTSVSQDTSCFPVRHPPLLVGLSDLERVA